MDDSGQRIKEMSLVTVLEDMCNQARTLQSGLCIYQRESKNTGRTREADLHWAGKVSICCDKRKRLSVYTVRETG